MDQREWGIRPSPEQLRRFLTLDVMGPDDDASYLADLAKLAGIDFRLELKLVTRTRKFWLCTQGAARPGLGLPPNYVVDYVTVEPNVPAGSGGVDLLYYGPEQTEQLQEIDYRNLVREQLDALAEQHEREPSEEVARRLKAARREMDALFEAAQEERHRTKPGGAGDVPAGEA